MRPMKGLFAGLLLFSAVASASVQKDFLRACEARMEQYGAQRATVEARAQQSAALAVHTISADDPSAPQALGAALLDTRQLATLYGRYEMLSSLQQFMAKKQSPASTDAWMQARVADLQNRITTANAVESEFRQHTPGKDVDMITWVGAAERLTQQRGNIEGAAAELGLIARDLRSYHAARAEEHERAVERRSAILIGIMAVLEEEQKDIHDMSIDAAVPGLRLCPDGSYVGGRTCQQAPNGKFVSGKPHLAPDGTWVGGEPQLAPNGRYVGGPGKPVLCPNGSYVSGACHRTPKGDYVGE